MLLLWLTHDMALICSQDEEIGGFMIQQNVAGRPVTVFRFPPRTRLKALSHATVSIAITNLHPLGLLALIYTGKTFIITLDTFMSNQSRCPNVILIWYSPVPLVGVVSSKFDETQSSIRLPVERPAQVGDWT